MIYLISANSLLFKSDKYSVTTTQEALEYLRTLKQVQLDTETSGLDCYTKTLLTLQLGSKDNQYVFDWTTISDSDKQLIKEYLESDVLILGFNLMFDLTFLYRNNIWPRHIYDNMIAEQLLYLGYPRVLTSELVSELNLNVPFYDFIKQEEGNSYYELSYSLKSTAKRRLGIDIDKSVRGDIIKYGLTEDVIVYAGTDVKWLEDIKDAQYVELQKQDLVQAVEFESNFVRALAYTKYCGIHLDVDKWKNKMQSDLDKLNKAKTELDNFVLELDKNKYIFQEAHNLKEAKKLESLGFELTDKPNVYKKYVSDLFTNYQLQYSLFEESNIGKYCNINWDSSQQVIKLFEIIGISVTTFDKKTKREKKSINEKILSPQVKDFPILETYLEYKEASKVVSTYGQNWLNAINPISGRIHVELHSIGTDTSRVSSGGGQYKLNQQNLPNDAVTRACFTAEKGNIWLSCDYSGQESRLLASVSKDKAMIDLFEQDGDIHSLVAYMSYPEIIPRNTDIKDIKKLYHHARQDAKGIEFSINYGGDFNTIAINKGISIKEAKQIYDNYMKGFTGIASYQDYCRKAVMEKGYIIMNPILKHRAHIFDFEWISRMEEKFKDREFWEYYNELKISAPGSDTVKAVKRYFERKSESEKQSINYRIQNRGACAYKLASILFFNWIVANNYQNIVKTVVEAHDEKNVECPIELKDIVSKKLVECMIEGGKPFCPNVFLGADIEIGECWIH